MTSHGNESLIFELRKTLRYHDMEKRSELFASTLWGEPSDHQLQRLLLVRCICFMLRYYSIYHYTLISASSSTLSTLIRTYAYSVTSVKICSIVFCELCVILIPLNVSTCHGNTTVVSCIRSCSHEYIRIWMGEKGSPGMWSAIMMTSSNGNILRVTGHLGWELTGHWWIPRTKTSDAELWCFLWSAPE